MLYTQVTSSYVLCGHGFLIHSLLSMHVERVAIIGAGVSGVVSAKNLGAAGLQVKVFERSSTLGGIWYAIAQVQSPFSLTLLF